MPTRDQKSLSTCLSFRASSVRASSVRALLCGLLCAATLLLSTVELSAGEKKTKSNTKTDDTQPKKKSGKTKSSDPANPSDTPDDAAGPEKENLPKFEEVEKVVNAHFAGMKKYQKGDILTQSDVAPLFKMLEELGWKVADAREITGMLLPNGDYIVKQLRTRPGRKFMRKISKHPGAYDRLDRLRKMPYGKRRVREFIDSPGGDTMIEYLATTRGGKNLGKMLSRGKNGRNFNRPTKRLYTAEDVLNRLKESYSGKPKPGAGKRSKRVRRRRTQRGPARRSSNAREK